MNATYRRSSSPVGRRAGAAERRGTGTGARTGVIRGGSPATILMEFRNRRRTVRALEALLELLRTEVVLSEVRAQFFNNAFAV
ncbi:MAG: hypothetical protein O2973_03075 [Gemmatimonadetes bacterium]|nr:hypothetical protein [Gemmatimonadota bacterium]